MQTQTEVAIIGAGLAGLSCGLHLHDHGVPFLLLESADAVGGRIRTDLVNGFLLDRGFQVLLTAYPEVKTTFDLGALDVQAFYPGALIRFAGRFHRVADPWRHPIDALRSAFSDIGYIADKLRVGQVRHEVGQGTLDELFQRPETTTQQRLQAAGISAAMIDRFFRPFLGGIYLEKELNTSSRMFDFVFRMFATGDTVLPAAGMEAIPRQLASRLPADLIRTNARVQKIQPGLVTLTSGETVTAQQIVVATDGPQGRAARGQPSQGQNSLRDLSLLCRRASAHQ